MTTTGINTLLAWVNDQPIPASIVLEPSRDLEAWVSVVLADGRSILRDVAKKRNRLKRLRIDPLPGFPFFSVDLIVKEARRSKAEQRIYWFLRSESSGLLGCGFLVPGTSGLEERAAALLPNFRRRGLYPSVLHHIQRTLGRTVLSDTLFISEMALKTWKRIGDFLPGMKSFQLAERNNPPLNKSEYHLAAAFLSFLATEAPSLRR